MREGKKTEWGGGAKTRMENVGSPPPRSYIVKKINS